MCVLNNGTGHVSLGSPGSKCQDRIKSVKRFIRGITYGEKGREIFGVGAIQIVMQI